MELVLVRHAEPVRVTDSDGPANPPLTERGRRQAEAVARWLAAEGPDALYASTQRRALETADALGRITGLEVRAEAGVAEYDRDASQYIPYEELKAARDPHWYALAESRLGDVAADGAAFRDRVVGAMEGIIARHPGERVVVFCHGGVINVYLAHVLGLERDLWFEPVYTSVSRVAASRGGVRSIASLNEAGHLRAPEGTEEDA